LFSKTPALRNAHGTLGKLYNNRRVPQSHQNCERLRPGGLSPEIKVSTLRHLATCQTVVLRSEIKVTFDLHSFSFASSLSHVWVTNPYPQHGDTTPGSQQNCERLRPGGLSPEIKISTLHHFATCQAVVLLSEIKVTFDLHNFSFASSLSHVWVTNPYPQHGDTTPESHQNCERLRRGGLSPEIKVSTLHHLATCQAVVLLSEIKVTFDLHNFSFASLLSHVWVTNPYPQPGGTTYLHGVLSI
jgi:hypothetical protein